MKHSKRQVDNFQFLRLIAAFHFPHYTTFPIEKQELIPQKTTGEPSKPSCCPFHSSK